MTIIGATNMVKYNKARNPRSAKPATSMGKLNLRAVPVICPKCGRRAMLKAMVVLKLEALRKTIDCRACGGTMNKLRRERRV